MLSIITERSMLKPESCYRLLLCSAASKQIGELALTKRLPLISLFAEFPKLGGLISYGPRYEEVPEDAAFTSGKSYTMSSQVTCRYSGRRNSIW